MFRPKQCIAAVAMLVLCPYFHSSKAHADIDANAALSKTGVLELRHAARIVSLCVAPDGKRLICSDATGRIHIWNLTGKLNRRQLMGFKGTCNLIALANDGKTLVARGDKGALVLWDVNTGNEIRRIDGVAPSVVWLAVSPRGKTIYWATRGGFS